MNVAGELENSNAMHVCDSLHVAAQSSIVMYVNGDESSLPISPTPVEPDPLMSYGQFV
jgi:hypothetical protein